MRQPNPILQNSFVKGLITEATEIAFPQNACTEAFDVVFDPKGPITRRKGFDFEDSYVTTNAPATQTGEVFTEWVWTAVAGNGEIAFLVQQQGKNLFFYDISTSIAVSPNKKSFSLDLTNYVPSGSGLNPAIYPCQYANGRGNLVIVNRACNPFYVAYSTTSDTITATGYNIQTRDFTGVDDGLGLTERPTGTVADLKTNNPAHYYNLLNQGWSENLGSALSAWDTARTDLPSNADYIALYRSSPTVNFDNARVNNQDPLNTPAAKGHYILTATNPDRTAAMVADGFTGASLTNPSVLIDRSAGTIISNNVSDLIYGTGLIAFDGVTSATRASAQWLYFIDTAANSWVGKNYSSQPRQISQAIVFGTNDDGFYYSGAPSITWTLKGSQTSPVNKTDGTTLGTITFTDAPNESGGRTIVSSDASTFWNYVWVYNDKSDLGHPMMLVEAQFYSPGGNPSEVPSTVERPKTVAFHAGRLFYAGLDAFSLNNTIFFTQILNKETQYGQCYQVNDPTNEELFNLLPSDGGTITIPELASVRKLFAYQNALLVFASNGVWLISGGRANGYGGGFAANDYFVKKLSSVGMNSPLSIVDRRGVPMWWGEDGIYTINYDANYNSFNVINITFKTIRSFFLDVPFANKQYVKGTYDPVYDVCYWLYSSEEGNTYNYNAVLCFNGVAGSFSPWTISEADAQVRGIILVQDAAHNHLPTIKYTTTYPSSSNEVLLYSETNNTGFFDWDTYSEISLDDSQRKDYTSYFITGYQVESKSQTYMESPYVWVFLSDVAVPAGFLLLEDDTELLLEDGEEIELEGTYPPGCYVQGVFDFTSSPNSGKWSNKQQCYNNQDYLNRTLNFRRLKVRGRGRAIQLKFTSQSGRPFQIAGWSVLESIAGNP